MNSLISMFIDNELELDEKIVFVEKVSKNKAFKKEAIELLHQEKLLRAEVVDRIPALRLKTKTKGLVSALRPIGLLIPAVGAAIIILFLVLPIRQNPSISHRFVIYRPDVNSAEIVGTFTGWQRIPMRRIGNSGWWDLKMNLPAGEHRFTYILDGRQRFADPTVPFREYDDFGGENSIISVESKT